MRFLGLMVALLTFGLLSAGCGWSPPAGDTPTAAAGCAAEGPSDETIQAEIDKLPAGDWEEVLRGYTANCALQWVVVTSGIASDSPSQVIFFDHKSPLGTATPEPRPYITVVAQGDDTAAVQYQWRQGDEPACCPTGIGTVRFTVEDGKLKALDPIPTP